MIAGISPIREILDGAGEGEAAVHPVVDPNFNDKDVRTLSTKLDENPYHQQTEFYSPPSKGCSHWNCSLCYKYDKLASGKWWGFPANKPNLLKSAKMQEFKDIVLMIELADLTDQIEAAAEELVPSSSVLDAIAGANLKKREAQKQIEEAQAKIEEADEQLRKKLSEEE
jgi:hypothetical protein